ncbi:hypothetical protein [Saccharicrinis aurantiacus]|uniref:hypothetical protein n=1 Tax=Saccharicrinis aurantiacus TaxID=1849719 RepID=UPI001C9E5972|nr:hypothetical protein [Saccharicrinis aurantiacus]
MKNDIMRLGHLTKIYGFNSLNETVLLKKQKENYIYDSIIIDYLYNRSYLATDSFVCDTTADIKSFYISFFKETPCTQYYMHNGEDKKHEIYGDGTGRNGDCSEDCIAFYSYHRSVDNPNMWYCNHPKERKDTIWTCKE